MTLAQRVLELEASPEPPESPQTVPEQQENVWGPLHDMASQKRSWWKRLLDLEYSNGAAGQSDTLYLSNRAP